MADIIDHGNETAELFNDVALRHREPEGPKATGYCLNCGQELLPWSGQPQRWCDAECRDDWEKRGA